MARHRAGDRRILSISIPEKLAKRLDRQVGRGREQGRSATIARLVELGMKAEASAPDLDVEVEPRVASAAADEVRLERDTMGELEVPADRYFGAQTARSLIMDRNIAKHGCTASVIGETT